MRNSNRPTEEEIRKLHQANRKLNLEALGERVLEILGEWNAERWRRIADAHVSSLGHSGTSMCDVLASARSLGLLGSPGESAPWDPEPDHGIPGCGHVECLGIGCDQETDQAHDEAQDMRATGADREQQARGRELDPDADRRAL